MERRQDRFASRNSSALKFSQQPNIGELYDIVQYTTQMKVQLLVMIFLLLFVLESQPDVFNKKVKKLVKS